MGGEGFPCRPFSKGHSFGCFLKDFSRRKGPDHAKNYLPPRTDGQRPALEDPLDGSGTGASGLSRRGGKVSQAHGGGL